MPTTLENLLQEMKRGTLVLSVLLNTDTPVYGYSMVQSLQEAGIEVEQNTLYPLLRRLEKQELVTSSWDTTETRPRKYYVITQKGVEIRKEMLKEWKKNNTVLMNMEDKL